MNHELLKNPMTSLRFVPKKMFVLFLGDLLIIPGAYLLAVMIRHKGASLLSSHPESILLFIYLFVFYLAELYDMELSFTSTRYVSRHLAGIGIGAVIVSLVFFFVPQIKTGRSVFLISSALIGITTLLWRFIFSLWLSHKANGKKTLLIIGPGPAGKTLYNLVKDNADYRFVGFMAENDTAKSEGEPLPQLIGTTNRIHEIVKVHKIDIIVLADRVVRDPRLLRRVLDCKLRGVQVHDMLSFYEKVAGKVPVEHVTDFWLVYTPLLGVKRSVYNQKIKRVIDVVLSFCGLILTFPVSVAVGLAVKFDSPGPMVYRQSRIGLNGKAFSLLKFRSMTTGTDHDRRFAGEPDDPRITRVGRILRLLRLDEIPQMWNVLKGNMSFIGPRALIEPEVEEFESKIPYFSLRHSIRPGITGWAQVNYRHGTSVEDGLEKLQYDLFYIKNLSPLLDFHILMKTVKVVLSGKGAR